MRRQLKPWRLPPQNLSKFEKKLPLAPLLCPPHLPRTQKRRKRLLALPRSRLRRKRKKQPQKAKNVKGPLPGKRLRAQPPAIVVASGSVLKAKVVQQAHPTAKSPSRNQQSCGSRWRTRKLFALNTTSLMYVVHTAVIFVCVFFVL